MEPPTDETEIRAFETRKVDHLRLALDQRVEAVGGSGFDRVQLLHDALPELNLNDISLDATVLGESTRVPLMISGMTAGHEGGIELNRRLAKACARRGWWMGVGSQRRQLFDENAREEWLSLREDIPNVVLLGNLGLSQAIETPVEKVQELVDSIRAHAMVIHTNPLQESMQMEGTPRFKGGVKTLKVLSESLSVPIILKETGCGVSALAFAKLKGLRLGAVDVSGFGGTHWGRIEGERAQEILKNTSQTFANWGLSTVESLLAGQQSEFELWASGGVRSGLDAAKALALDASMVGFAKPALVAAIEGETALDRWMEQMELELKVAMFCTGCGSISDLRTRKVWQWQKI